MRLWLHTSAKSSVMLPSTALSVAAHVALVGAAVFGTAARARDIKEEIAQRVYYLPPPDRHPSEQPSIEHLQYIEVGGGRPSPASLTGTTAPTVGNGDLHARKAGGEQGRDAQSQLASTPIQSPDSVFSILEVEESAARAEGSAAPAYPPDLVKAGVEGVVVTRYIVDTTGRADPASLQVLSASHPLFIDAVRGALPGMLFTPATVHGRRVRQVVEQNFQFKLNMPTPAEHTRATAIP